MRRRVHLGILVLLFILFVVGSILFFVGLTIDNLFALRLGVLLALPFLGACIIFGKKLFEIEKAKKPVLALIMYLSEDLEQTLQLGVADLYDVQNSELRWWEYYPDLVSVEK